MGIFKHKENNPDVKEASAEASSLHLKRKIYNILIVVSAIVFVVSVFFLGRRIYQYKQADKIYNDSRKYVEINPTDSASENPTTDSSNASNEIVFPLKSFDYDSIHNMSPDTFGWIVVPSVSISYPLLQGTDNDYYLSHTYTGEENWNGSIYLDYRQNNDLSDRHVFIYGHKIENGSMFAELLRYDDKDFFEHQKEANNHYFYIYLKDEVKVYEIFSVVDSQISDNPMLFKLSFPAKDNSESCDEFLKLLKENDLYDTGIQAENTDTFVTLYTCQKPSPSQIRHLVTGKLVKTVTYDEINS